MKALVRWTAWMVWAALLLGTQAVVAQPASADALIEQYYVNILGRPFDLAGKTYWLGEVQRTQDLGIDVKEAFMVMAGVFFASPEYTAKNTSDAQYVTDLYKTFLNRSPDGGGLAYWTGLLSAGVSRAVVMNGFMFAPEFAAYMGSLPGNAVSRPEVYASVDFYRGLLGRLPDNPGFNYWLYQFQIAQCGGAAMVYNATEILSSSFAVSSEYLARNRSDVEYVSDLYYAFLRRSADQTGFLYWIGQLSTKAQTRDQLRKAFIASPEFTARVNAVIAAGCVPSPDPCTLKSTSGTVPVPTTDVPAACGTASAPTDGSCDVTLTLACTGGAATSYSWSSSVSNSTLALNTAPPSSRQKVTVTTPQTFAASASNASGTSTTLPVSITVGTSAGGTGGSGGTGGTGGSGTGGAVDCSLQGFATTHYIELPLNAPLGVSTYKFDAGKYNLTTPDTMGPHDIFVIKFNFDSSQNGQLVQFSSSGQPYLGTYNRSMVISANPCDWAADMPGVKHMGPDAEVQPSLTPLIGDPSLPANSFYLIVTNREPADVFYPPGVLYAPKNTWNCTSSCDVRVSRAH